MSFKFPLESEREREQSQHSTVRVKELPMSSSQYGLEWNYSLQNSNLILYHVYQAFKYILWNVCGFGSVLKLNFISSSLDIASINSMVGRTSSKKNVYGRGNGKKPFSTFLPISSWWMSRTWIGNEIEEAAGKKEVISLFLMYSSRTVQLLRVDNSEKTFPFSLFLIHTDHRIALKYCQGLGS